MHGQIFPLAIDPVCYGYILWLFRKMHWPVWITSIFVAVEIFPGSFYLYFFLIEFFHPIAFHLLVFLLLIIPLEIYRLLLLSAYSYTFKFSFH